jgi:hypothetical protein
MIMFTLWFAVLSTAAALAAACPLCLLIWLTLRGASVSQRRELLPELGRAMRAIASTGRDDTRHGPGRLRRAEAGSGSSGPAERS